MYSIYVFKNIIPENILYDKIFYKAKELYIKSHKNICTL